MTGRTETPWDRIAGALLAASIAAACAGGALRPGSGGASPPPAPSPSRDGAKEPSVRAPADAASATARQTARRPIANLLFTGATLGYATPCG